MIETQHSMEGRVTATHSVTLELQIMVEMGNVVTSEWIPHPPEIRQVPTAQQVAMMGDQAHITRRS